MTQRSPRANRRNPVSRFFGEEAATGSPFDLLDLGADDLTDAAIVAALDRRLATLAEHVECDTPEADEVRLAMHAAAAQLLDPHVRRHLTAQWGGGSAPRRESQRAAPRTPHDPRIALEHDVVLAVALHGGWNDKALGHVVSLANARGMSSDDLGRAIAQLHAARTRRTDARASIAPASATRPSTGATTVAAGSGLSTHAGSSSRQDSASTPEPRRAVDPAEKALRKSTLVTIGCTGLIAIVAFGVGIVLLTTPPTPAPTPPTTNTPEVANTPAVDAPAAQTPEPITAKQDPTPQPPLAMTDGTFDPADIVRRLAACTAGAEVDPEAATTEFGLIIEQISQNWPRLKPDQLVSVNHGVVEFVYRIALGGASTSVDVGDGRGGGGGGGGAIDLIAGDRSVSSVSGPIKPDEVAGTIWSAGMLTRLGRERDLPATTVMRLRQHIARMFGDHGVASAPPHGAATFDSAALSAVGLLPERLSLPTVSVESWRSWLSAVGALAPPPAGDARDDHGHHRIILGGLEHLLAHGPDPSRDEATFRVVRMLVMDVSWQPGSESREWLLARFNDARLSAADLHTVTSAVVTKSREVDITMVLPVLASDQVRVELRDRYVQAWGLDPGQRRDELTSAIVRAASTVFIEVELARSPTEYLAAAVRLSRLSEAARWVYRGQTDEASRLVDALDADGVLDAAIRSGAPSPTVVTIQRGGRSWTERYLAAGRNVPVRLSLLDEVAHSIDGESPDAEVLVAEALRGSPVAVRSRAKEIVLALSNEPAVVAALLEALPLVYETPDTSDIIAYVAATSLPPVHDVRWGPAARRALVERLLQLTAAEGEFARVDQFAQLLARSYMGRAADTPLAEGAAIADIENSAARIWTAWWSGVGGGRGSGAGMTAVGGSGLTLEALERRRTGRLAISRGLVQVFAAQQISVCELMALVVGQERPHHQVEIAGLLETLAQQRRSATSVIKQIQDTEAVMLKLWLLRLGEGPA